MKEIGTVYEIKVNVMKREKTCPIHNIAFYIEKEKSVECEQNEDGFYVINSNLFGRGRLMCRIELFHENRTIVLERYTGLAFGERFITDKKYCDGFEVYFEIKDCAYIFFGCVKDKIFSYEELGERIIENNSLSKIICEKGKRLEIDVKEGDKVVVLVPANGIVAVKKDDGFGGMMPFSTSIMGANGEFSTSVDGKNYNIYGEFVLVNGKLVIYIV